MPIAEDGTTVPASFYNTLGEGLVRDPSGQIRRVAPDRALQRATRRMAEANARLIAAVPTTQTIIATVKTVMTGQAVDGNAVVMVTWRDSVLVANGYGSTYTPVVGHRVLCALVDNQLIVLDRLIGAP